MAPFTSTIPGAVTALQGYMQSVAASTTVTNVNVYVGYSTPLTGMSDNFLMVGDYEEGTLYAVAESDWASWSVTAKRRTEDYSLNGCIRCYAGGNDWQSRLNDAMSLLDALEEQIVSDPAGAGSLSGGNWGRFTHHNVVNGPLVNTGGYGVVIGFDLQVQNVRITG